MYIEMIIVRCNVGLAIASHTVYIELYKILTL